MGAHYSIVALDYYIDSALWPSRHFVFVLRRRSGRSQDHNISWDQYVVTSPGFTHEELLLLSFKYEEPAEIMELGGLNY